MSSASATNLQSLTLRHPAFDPTSEGLSGGGSSSNLATPSPARERQAYFVGRAS